MSVFTDDDLKRLKEDIDEAGSSYRIPTEDLFALLARLEAAERALLLGEGVLHEGEPVPSGPEGEPEPYRWNPSHFTEALEAWRKSKGEL